MGQHTSKEAKKVTEEIDQNSIDRICTDLYRETRTFLQTINFEAPLSFKILNGPPIRNAETLFIGYQPGGDEEDAKNEISKGTHLRWPPVCEYATETWPLAPKMQRIFGVGRLKQCVGTNVIFLRYSDARSYRAHVGEKQNAIEKFCKDKVEILVNAINPVRIITIGFKALEMFGPTEIGLLRQDGKNALTKIGRIANRPAIGMIHLTGARPFSSELDRLAEHFKR